MAVGVDETPRDPWVRTIALITFAIAAVLIFTRLGHYALWDDEANTALIGEGVWATGDTSAMIGQNVVAYANGYELKNLRARLIPPLQYYLVAPFVGPSPGSALMARLPFALFGVATVALLLHWLRRVSTNRMLWAVFCIALVCNVEMCLYARQCRYYSVVIFASTAAAYLYWYWDGRRRSVVLLSLSLAAVLASTYTNFPPLLACLGVDFAIWGWRRGTVTWKQILAVLLPVVVVGVAIVSIWNPRSGMVALSDNMPWLPAKLQLLYWYVRDLNTNQFYCGGLLVVAIVLAVRGQGSPLLRRGLVAMAVYVVTTTMFSIQQVGATDVAAVRYVTPILPLGLAIGAGTVWMLSRDRWWIAIPLALIAFGTNILNGGAFLAAPTESPVTREPFYSPTLAFVRELIEPAHDPYRAAADWVNANVKPEESVWVYGMFERFPLMFHARHAVYAWQLEWPPEPQFAALPPIHFVGREAPDYIVAFGPARLAMSRDSDFLRHPRYQLVAQIDTYWQELYRPEIFWRSFQLVPVANPATDAIYVFRRLPAD